MYADVLHIGPWSMPTKALREMLIWRTWVSTCFGKIMEKSVSGLDHPAWRRYGQL